MDIQPLRLKHLHCDDLHIILSFPAVQIYVCWLGNFESETLWEWTIRFFIFFCFFFLWVLVSLIRVITIVLRGKFGSFHVSGKLPTYPSPLFPNFRKWLWLLTLLCS